MRASVKTSASVFSSVFVGLLVVGGAVQAQSFARGTGGAGDPYRIATAEQLLGIEADPSFLDKCFVLVADIDLDPNLPGGRVFDAALIAPDLLDANGLDTPGVPFTGSFDGRGHVIRNLAIAAKTRDTVGLFGRIGVRDAGKWRTPGVVQNVRLEGAIVAGRESVGALAGANEGTILNCSVRGSVTGDEGVGGLVGGAQGNPSTDRSFWDVDTTGFAARSNGGVGLHTADLQRAQTYLDAGWDFVETWMICEGVDYPRLQWEQRDCDDDGETQE